MLAGDPRELDFKFCNKIEDPFHEGNGWVIQESMLSQLKHDMARVEEGHKPAFRHASAPTMAYIKRIDKLTALVESGFTKDEECCLVCGDAAYEEDNMIGFCDMCGLSVHRECYGLDVLDSTTDFVCNNCLAFSTQFSMNSLCVLCGHPGGAQLPSSLLQDEFGIAFKNLQDHSILSQRNLTADQIIEEEREHARLGGKNVAMDDAKIPYDARLRKRGSRNLHRPKYAWVHHCCYYWVAAELDLKTPLVLTKATKVATWGPRLIKRYLEQQQIQCELCGSAYGVKVRCPGNPCEVLQTIYAGADALGRHVSETHNKCQRFFHPECARKARYNLSLDFRQIFCPEHRKELRFEAIKVFKRVRNKEITDFAENLKACYSYVEQRDSIKAQVQAKIAQQKLQ